MMEFGKKKEGKKATRKHAHLIFQISCKQTTHVMHAMFHICKHVEKTHQMKEVRFYLILHCTARPGFDVFFLVFF